MPNMEYVISMNLVVTALGWAGALLSLSSYLLVTMGRLQARSVTYQLMVLLSATALAISSAVNNAWPSAVTNGIYMLIGVAMIVMLLRSRIGRAAANASRVVGGAVRTVMGSAFTFARRRHAAVPVRQREAVRVLSRAGQTGAGRRVRPGTAPVARGSVRPAARRPDTAPATSTSPSTVA